MGAKESRIQGQVAAVRRGTYVAHGHHRHASSAHPQTRAVTSLAAKASHQHRPHNPTATRPPEPTRKTSAGDMCSYNSNCGASAVRIPETSFGDEAVSKIPQEAAADPKKESQKHEGLSFLRPFPKFGEEDDSGFCESDTSTSSSSYDESAEACIERLKSRKKKVPARPKIPVPSTTNDDTTITEEVKDGQLRSTASCSSELSSSSTSMPSCCTPQPEVTFAKLKRAGAEKKRFAEQSQLREVTSLPTLQQNPPQPVVQKSLSSSLVHETSAVKPAARPNDCFLSVPPKAKQWTTPKPSPKIGFKTLDDGEVIFTGFLQLRGKGVDEYENTKRRTARSLRGLQCQHNCQIKLYDDVVERRTRMVHKIRIRGPGYREVLRCKNSLPRSIADLLVTAHCTADDCALMRQKRQQS